MLGSYFVAECPSVRLYLIFSLVIRLRLRVCNKNVIEAMCLSQHLVSVLHDLDMSLHWASAGFLSCRVAASPFGVDQ